MARTLALLLSCTLLFADILRAQSFTGTYTVPSQTGGVVTLILKQDPPGRIAGTLSGNGNTFQIEGQVSGPDFMGLASGAGGGGVYLEGHLEGNGIRVILAELGPGNQPRYDQARELLFVRQAAGGPPAAGAQTPAPAGNPLAGGAARVGNPLSAAAAPDPYVGSFAGTNVTATFRRAGEQYEGAIAVQGVEYPLTARRVGDRLTGTFKSGGTTYLFEARLQGNTLSLLSDGQTMTLERRGASPGPTPSPLAGQGGGGAGGGGPSGMSPQDAQLAQLLLSSKWCHFSYSGVAGSSSGSSYTENVFFSPDGTMVMQTGGESYYSADVRSSLGNVIAQGSTAGQRGGGGGQQFRWRVSQGALMLSSDGATWEPVPLQVTRNSSGYPIVTASGKEYSQC